MGTSGSHGFARNSHFEVAELRPASVVLVLRSSESTLQKWNHEFELTVCVELTEDSKLIQTVEVLNRSSELMRFTNALHSYFKVSDISNVTVTGLEGCAYHDNLAGRALTDGSAAAVAIGAEVDRIYANTGPEICIHDEGAHLKISIKKDNFADAVIWNPWIEKSKTLKDFGDEEYKRMLCVEPANAAMYLSGSAIEVQPGAKWRCQQSISAVAELA